MMSGTRVECRLRNRRTFLLLAFLACASARAPSVAAQPVFVGVKSGIAWTEQIEAARGFEYDTTAKREFVGGFVVRGALTPWLSLQGELFFMEKGDRRIEVWYLDAPVLMRLSTPGSLLGVEPIVTAGVVPGVEVSCEGGLEELPTTLGHAGRRRFRPILCDNERTDRSDWALLFGVGISRPVEEMPFTLEVRYLKGMTDVTSGFPEKVRYNRSLSVLFGVDFGL